MGGLRPRLTRLIGFALLLASFASSAQAAVFGLVDTGELYSSTNAGATWSILATLPVNDAVGIAAGSSPSQLFIATRSGTLYRSTNAGTSWSAVGALTASDIASFTINYDASILVLTESGTLYRSTDGGATFTGLAALTGANFVSLVRGPLGRLYALAKTGEVYESQNQGTTWTAVGSAALSNAVAMRRKVGELYILAETGEVYRSLDYGRTWLGVGAITASNLRAIQDSGSILLAAAETGEIYSSSNGSTWGAVGAINQLRVRGLGSDTPLATGVPVEEITPRIQVSAPYPNPANRQSGSIFGVTTVEPGRVRLELFDARGRRIATLGPISFDAGTHAISWRPSVAPGGAYFVRVSAEAGQAATTRWTLIE